MGPAIDSTALNIGAEDSFTRYQLERQPSPVFANVCLVFAQRLFRQPPLGHSPHNGLRRPFARHCHHALYDVGRYGECAGRDGVYFDAG